MTARSSRPWIWSTVISLLLPIGLLAQPVPLRPAKPARVSKPLPQLKTPQHATPVVPVKLRHAFLKADGSGQPIPNFAVGGKTWKFTGTTYPAASVAVPLAIIVAPPYEKVIRSYAFRRDELNIPALNLIVFRAGLRSRNVHDDILPLSILPEQVYTTFTHGQTSTVSNSSCIEMGFSMTYSVGAGGELEGMGFEVAVERSIEKTCGTEEGNAVYKTVETAGTLGGNNWLVSELARVFVVQTNYIMYEYRPEAGGAPILIGVPDTFTPECVGLDDWNTYAQDVNKRDDQSVTLPEFHPAFPWWVGNVEFYPQAAGYCMMQLPHTQ